MGPVPPPHCRCRRSKDRSQAADWLYTELRPTVCRPSVALQAVILVMWHIAACSTNHQCKATGRLPCVCKACNIMLTAGLRRIEQECQNIRSRVGVHKPTVVSQHSKLCCCMHTDKHTASLECGATALITCWFCAAVYLVLATRT